MISATDAPDGFANVTPYFTVDAADACMAFLIAAFGATVIYENRHDDGRLQHARVRIGNSILMMNQSSDEYPANVSQMHLFVSDTEAVYAAALEAGGISIMTPNIRPHGDTMAGVTDPAGNRWWIATHSA